MVKIHFFRKLWATLSIIGCFFPLCLMSCGKTSEPSLDGLPSKKYKYKKTFDASVLNKYYSGQFTLAWDKKSDCELISTKDFKINPLKINGKQHQVKLLNLGNGQFREKKDFYTIKTIGKNAFKDNKNIGEVLVVPTMIKAIDQNAFANTTIKNICIKNVTDFLPINENAFDGCEIKKIFVHNDLYKTNSEWNKICKKIISKPYESSDYEKFISQRTIEIGAVYAKGEDNWTRTTGTAWFVDKVNRNDENDYKYWIATNLHVCSDVSEYKNKNIDKLVNVYIHSKHFFHTKNDEKIPKKLPYDWYQIDIPIKVKINSIENANQNFNQDFCIMEIEIKPDFSIDDIPISLKEKFKKLYDKASSQYFENIKKMITPWLNALNRNLSLNNSFVVYATNVLEKEAKIYSLGFRSLGFAKSEYSFQEGEIYFNKKDHFLPNNCYHKWSYGIRNSNKIGFGNGTSGSMIIDENFNVVGMHYGSMEVTNGYDSGNTTNLSVCLHVNDEYNPIATFLYD